MKKRVLSLILCAVMLVSLFPAVYAEGEADMTIDLVETAVDDGIVMVEPDTTGAADPAAVGGGVSDSPTETGNDGDAPGESDTAAVGAGVPNGPTETGDTEETGGETPADDTDNTQAETPVRVVFVCEPEETGITVYDSEVLDEYGEPVGIEPEEDGSYLLLPGQYCYDAAAEGYVSLEEEAFTVEAAEENAPPQEIRVTLEAEVPAGTDGEIPAADDTADEPADGDGETPDEDDTPDAQDDSGAEDTANAFEEPAGDGTVRCGSSLPASLPIRRSPSSAAKRMKAASLA